MKKKLSSHVPKKTEQKRLHSSNIWKPAKSDMKTNLGSQKSQKQDSKIKNENKGPIF